MLFDNSFLVVTEDAERQLFKWNLDYWPICKLYKLEIYAEADNLPPITSLPENSNEEYDDEMQISAVELIN